MLFQNFVYGGLQNAAKISLCGDAVLASVPQPEPASTPEVFSDIKLYHIVNILIPR